MPGTSGINSASEIDPRLAQSRAIVHISALSATAQVKKPNILVIFGDDIGYCNISAYNAAMAGYKTPNIDRVAREDALFTNYYAQQPCTGGRVAFITGQSPIRTGLLKVGLPGADLGLFVDGQVMGMYLFRLWELCFDSRCSWIFHQQEPERKCGLSARIAPGGE